MIPFKRSICTINGKNGLTDSIRRWACTGGGGVQGVRTPPLPAFLVFVSILIIVTTQSSLGNRECTGVKTGF